MVNAEQQTQRRSEPHRLRGAGGGEAVRFVPGVWPGVAGRGRKRGVFHSWLLRHDAATRRLHPATLLRICSRRMLFALNNRASHPSFSEGSRPGLPFQRPPTAILCPCQSRPCRRQDAGEPSIQGPHARHPTATPNGACQPLPSADCLSQRNILLACRPAFPPVVSVIPVISLILSVILLPLPFVRTSPSPSPPLPVPQPPFFLLTRKTQQAEAQQHSFSPFTILLLSLF